jgi:hypothetical protein
VKRRPLCGSRGRDEEEMGRAARLCQAKCERLSHFVEPGAVAMGNGYREGGQVVPGKV